MKNKINAHENILSLIGNTPLVKLNKVTKNFEGDYYAKYEAMNPGQSNKDRIALHIIESAEKKGLIDKNTTIIETTSGNTGFSLSMVSMVKGYKCIVAVSSKSSPDKIDMLKAMGAKVYVCPANVPADDKRSYYQVAKRLNEEIKDSFYVNQYFNELNIDAHYKTTGPEIWKQTCGKVDGFICAIGSGGTIAGVTKYLKKKNTKIQIGLSDPCGSALYNYYKINKMESEGNSITEGIGQGRITKNLENFKPDYSFRISDEPAIIELQNLLKYEGLYLGGSSAINLVGAVELVKQMGKGHTICTILCDSGQRYESKIWNKEFLKMNNLPIPEWLI